MIKRAQLGRADTWSCGFSEKSAEPPAEGVPADDLVGAVVEFGGHGGQTFGGVPAHLDAAIESVRLIVVQGRDAAGAWSVRRNERGSVEREGVRRWSRPAWVRAAAATTPRTVAAQRAGRYFAYAVRKRSRNASIRHTGAAGPGRIPSSQPHPAIRASAAGFFDTTVIGTSRVASAPVTSGAG